MKMNKKLLALVCTGALLAALGLFGCGSGSNGGSQEADTQATDTSAAPEAAQPETSAPVVAGDYTLVTPGTLTILTSPDYPPFENLEDGEFVGFDIELGQAIAEKLGLEPEYKSANFESIITAIAGSTEGDVGISGFSVDPDRAQEIDFSDSYYTDDQAVAVMSGGDVTSDNAEEALNQEGISIAVQSGTTGETYVKEHFPNAEVVPYTNSTDCFAYMQSGNVDAVCTNYAVVSKMIETSYPDAEIVIQVATGEDYAIVVSKENPALTAAINDALAQLKADGTVDSLLEKWM